MSPRASTRRGAAAAAAAAKRRSRGKKATATSQPEIVSKENKASESEVLPSPVEETKLPEVAQNSSEEEKKEVSQAERLLEPEVQEGEEVLRTVDEDKVVTTGETSLTTVVVKEEPKVKEEVVEETISEIVSEDFVIFNASNVKVERDDMQDEEAGERNDGDKENGAALMDLDKDTRKESDEGAKRDVVNEETAAAKVEDTKGSSEAEDSDGSGEVEDIKEDGVIDGSKVGGDRAKNADANGTVNKDVEADKSGSDEEDNEEEEDPSVYMEAPLTDRKKEKEFEIFVGGLDKEAIEDDLIKIFGKFGEIQSARIVKHQTTQKSKGFAFIRYVTVEQAKKVLVELKDGIEVRGKRVGISPSQDNDTLHVGNICKTWTKEQVLETLKSFGIEQIDEIYLPDDPNNDGKNKGFALLEFSTHSDAMTAFQRLRKPDAIFGCDRSAKVAFALSSIHPSEEALSQVKTVFIEGLTDSWDEGKVKELCKQYGGIEKVQLSRSLGKKRKDFGFVAFTSRESAIACVEGINNAQIGEGDIKVKANLAKPQNKGRLAKQGARGDFKVKKEGEKAEETGPLKMKGRAKSKGGKGKGKKPLPNLKNVKGGKPYETQGSLARSHGSGLPSRSERTNQQRSRQPPQGEKRGRRDMDTGYNGQPSKKAHGNMHGRPPNNSSESRRNRSYSGKPRANYSASSTAYGVPYAQGYAAASSSRYHDHIYGAASGSKRPYSDMEPHAGFLEPAANKQSRDAYGYGPRRPVGYDVQGSSGAAFGGVNPGSVVPPYVSNYAGYGGYEGGGTGSSYGYPRSAAYPPRQAYY